MERTENEKIMQKKRMNKKENWVQAQKQAKQMGIVLTKRKNSKGEYVCYLDKKSKGGWLAVL
jgi:hypothetical protein